MPAPPELEPRVARRAQPNRRRRSLPVLLAALFVACGAALLLSSSGCHRSRPGRPLIVVAVDGLEWRLLLRFAQEGVLPNFTRMMGEGYAGKLETMEPTLSPVIWTTIATGKRPEEHGIEGFSYRDDQGVDHLYTSLQRRSKAFWNLLTESGEVCHVDGWWCTWPVEDVEDGSMVAQTTTRGQIDVKSGQIWKGTYLKGMPGQVWPDELIPVMDAHVDRLVEEAPELLERTFGGAAKAAAKAAQEAESGATGAPDDSGTAPTSPRLLAQMWRLVSTSFCSDVLFLDAARDVLDAKKPFDLLAVYFGSTDVASHQFWRHFEPGLYQHPPPAAEVAAYGNVIRDTYRFVDAALGELRAKAPDADFLILSDHGFHAVNQELDFEASFARKEKRIESGHHLDAPPGVLIACGPSFARAPVVVGTDPSLLRTVGSVHDVLPTLLVLKDIPYGEDMAGRPLRQLFTEETLAAHPIRSVKSHDDADWQKRRANARTQAALYERNFELSLQRLDRREMERLRQIGYSVGDPAPPPADGRDGGGGGGK
jgi:predicted AlkP superfamily pyrophosphatase or phosphodiesterase